MRNFAPPSQLDMGLHLGVCLSVYSRYPPTCYAACGQESSESDCFYDGESSSTKLKLQTWNATQRQFMFDEVVSNGYLDGRTSHISVNALLWNPDTAFLFEVQAVTAFKAGGVLDTDVRLDCFFVCLFVWSKWQMCKWQMHICTNAKNAQNIKCTDSKC